MFCLSLGRPLFTGLTVYCYITGSTVIDDITPNKGTIFYVSNEGSKKFIISVLPDDLPEGQEVSVTCEKIIYKYFTENISPVKLMIK